MRALTIVLAATSCKASAEAGATRQETTLDARLNTLDHVLSGVLDKEDTHDKLGLTAAAFPLAAQEMGTTMPQEGSRSAAEQEASRVAAEEEVHAPPSASAPPSPGVGTPCTHIDERGFNGLTPCKKGWYCKQYKYNSFASTGFCTPLGEYKEHDAEKDYECRSDSHCVQYGEKIEYWDNTIFGESNPLRRCFTFNAVDYNSHTGESHKYDRCFDEHGTYSSYHVPPATYHLPRTTCHATCQETTGKYRTKECSFWGCAKDPWPK